MGLRWIPLRMCLGCIVTVVVWQSQRLCVFSETVRGNLHTFQRLHYWKEEVKNPADASEAPGEGRVAHTHSFRDVTSDAEKQYLHVPLLTVSIHCVGLTHMEHTHAQIMAVYG